MSGKRALVFILGLLGIVAMIGAGAIALLVTIDLRPVIERYATQTLDRRLTIGSLRIGWGNPLSLDAEDVRLANASWGSEPDMVRIASLSARIDVRQLLHGVLRYDRLVLEKPTILLERNAEGAPNWRMKAHRSASSGGLAVLPKNRSQFPTLIDLALREGALVYRVPGRRDLRLDARILAINSAGDDRPVRLALNGAYNGTPTALAGETQSFALLRDATVPYGTDLTITAAPGRLRFKGTMSEPLDLEGAKGTLQIDAAKLGDLLQMVGTELQADFSIHLAGPLEKTGDHWHLTDAKGSLGKNPLAGALSLDEAPRGRPDAIAMDLGFGELDLKALLGNERKLGGAKANWADRISFGLEAEPAATIDARLAAKQLAWGTTRVADFAFRGRLLPGEISVAGLEFALAGGRIDASGAAHAAGRGSRVTARLAVAGAETGKLAELAGAQPAQLVGKLDAQATVDMTGETLTDALKASQGQAVLSMTGGRVARALLERASADLKALFREGEGWAPVTCLRGAIDLYDGIATIAPLRLRTPYTTLLAGGELNLLSRHIDMTLKSEGGQSVFALNVPLRITGELTKPRIVPALGATPKSESPRRLAPTLQRLAERNPCLSPEDRGAGSRIRPPPLSGSSERPSR